MDLDVKNAKKMQEHFKSIQKLIVNLAIALKLEHNIRPLFFLLLFLCFSHSCRKEKPSTPEVFDCVETIDSPSFANDIEPILAANCYRCHSNENNATLAESIDLEDHQDIFPMAKNGKLIGSIRHDEDCVPMPLDDDKMPQCNIEKVERWILEGAMNN